VNLGSETPLFRIAPGVQLVFLAIQINEPNGKTPMEVVNQFCRVATDSQGIRSLVPTKCWTEHAGSAGSKVVVAKWKGRFHPRLSVGAASGHEFPFLVVDLTFVHATAFLARDPEMDPAYNKDVGPRPHHGCDLQALEFTHKDGPATWFVTVPPALNTAELNPMRPRGWSGGETSDRGARAFDVLVYLRPRLAKNGKLVTYTELGDTPLLGRLNRLVAVPKPGMAILRGPERRMEPGPVRQLRAAIDREWQKDPRRPPVAEWDQFRSSLHAESPANPRPRAHRPAGKRRDQPRQRAGYSDRAHRRRRIQRRRQ
jgi:hypothetical protein